MTVLPRERGSEWSKWDLQVQTILDDGYVPLTSYYQEIKAVYPAEWERYASMVGGEANALLFDTKAYFNNASIDKQERCINYVRNFFAYLQVFRPDLKCIGITDHNYFDDQLIDVFWEYSKRANCKILCGVEVNVSGTHLLVFFPCAPYAKESYSSGIHAFLIKFDVNNRFTNGVLTVSSKALPDVLEEVRKLRGIVIYPHCNSNNGLFQERGQTDRTYLADVFNYQKMNLLQSMHKSSCEQVIEFINERDTLTSDFCFTLGSDARALKDIGKPDDEGNYLWIKSAPTFEGLKQIIYEPKERVALQVDSPFKDKQKIFFRELKFSGSKHYVIPDVSIPLNRELVAIIGGRGSGKSALLESIAFINEEHARTDQNGKPKIVEYYRQNLDGREPAPGFNLSATLVSKDDVEEIHAKSLEQTDSLELPFLYIGQEQLSGMATNDIELT